MAQLLTNNFNFFSLERVSVLSGKNTIEEADSNTDEIFINSGCSSVRSLSTNCTPSQRASF